MPEDSPGGELHHSAANCDVFGPNCVILRNPVGRRVQHDQVATGLWRDDGPLRPPRARVLFAAPVELAVRGRGCRRGRSRRWWRPVRHRVDQRERTDAVSFWVSCRRDLCAPVARASVRMRGVCVLCVVRARVRVLCARVRDARDDALARRDAMTARYCFGAVGLLLSMTLSCACVCVCVCMCVCVCFSLCMCVFLSVYVCVSLCARHACCSTKYRHEMAVAALGALMLAYGCLMSLLRIKMGNYLVYSS